MLGIDPELIVADKEVAMIRQQRAQAQQQAAQAEAQQRAAENVSKLGNTNPDNVMDMMNQFSGYNSPSPMEV